MSGMCAENGWMWENKEWKDVQSTTEVWKAGDGYMEKYGCA